MRTWLIQRLLVPRENRGTGPLANAHRVFGGGMLGLTTDMWELLDPIFELDYMGAAEFEFGKIPKVIGELVHDKTLTVGDFVIKASEYKPSWSREAALREVRRRELDDAWKAGTKPKRASRSKKKQVEGLPVMQDRRVYYLCRRDHVRYVHDTVLDLAVGKLQLKEGARLSNALDPIDDRDHRYGGWLELDNGFFFFTNEKMWLETARLFGVQVCGETSATTET